MSEKSESWKSSCPSCGSIDRELYKSPCNDLYWQGKANPFHDKPETAITESTTKPDPEMESDMDRPWTQTPPSRSRHK
jgi:hypothetical protein